jgi:fumarate reductase flavoprotein subunit
MVVKYRPELDGFVTTNHKGATGSGIAILQKIGAGTVDMGEIQIHPTVEQTTSYLISEPSVAAGRFWSVRRASGSSMRWKPATKCRRDIIALPEKFAYVVFDEQIREQQSGG